MSGFAESEDGERKRVLHALARMEDCVRAMRIAITQDAPLGLEGPNALVTTASEILAHASAADAYRRAGGR